jgi:hypothetical protein
MSSNARPPTVVFPNKVKELKSWQIAVAPQIVQISKWQNTAASSQSMVNRMRRRQQAPGQRRKDPSGLVLDVLSAVKQVACLFIEDPQQVMKVKMMF